MPSFSNQYWLHCRVRSHRLPRRQRLTRNLHYLLYLPYLSTHPGRTASTTSLDTWPIRYLCQHWRSIVSACGLGLCVLSCRNSCYAKHDELERSHVWRNYDIRHRLLSLTGKKDLHIPSGIGKEKLGGFSSLRPHVYKGCTRFMLPLNSPSTRP